MPELVLIHHGHGNGRHGHRWHVHLDNLLSSDFARPALFTLLLERLLSAAFGLGLSLGTHNVEQEAHYCI